MFTLDVSVDILSFSKCHTIYYQLYMKFILIYMLGNLPEVRRFCVFLRFQNVSYMSIKQNLLCFLPISDSEMKTAIDYISQLMKS